MGEGVTEEKVEYRDEEGNLLNDEQVAALQGKVSFSTRYETRTRLVDEVGNVIQDGQVDVQDGELPAPPKPEGVDPKTVKGGDAYEGEPNTEKAPKQNNIKDDLAKEKNIPDVKATPEPGSDAEKKTKDEL